MQLASLEEIQVTHAWGAQTSCETSSSSSVNENMIIISKTHNFIANENKNTIFKIHGVKISRYNKIEEQNTLNNKKAEANKPHFHIFFSVFRNR